MIGRRLQLVMCLPGVLVCGCRRPAEPDGGVPVWGYRVVARFPHDREAWTQGLAYDEGFLYEGTGGYGASSLRKVGLVSGHVVLRRDLGAAYFGEGITILGDRIVQVTWRERVGFVYDKATFRRIAEFAIPGEGWGLAWDGRRLILSDGSDRLTFLDADTFEPTGSIQVTAGGRPLKDLNELEYIKGRIYANVWRTDRLAVIDPDTGQVEAFWDLSGLSEADAARRAEVLNGIAYDAEGNRLFVTGKLWPWVFHVEPVIRGQ